MERSFAYRRLEVVNQCPAIQDFRERCPALFSEAQIKEEFRRITTVHLERTFLSKLDLYTPKLQEILGKKGGVAGTKIRPLLDSLSQQHVESKREAMGFLGESSGDLIKDYMDVSREAAEKDQAEQVLKICVFHGCEEGEGPSHTDVSIVVEGTQVLYKCGSVARACLLLMGIIYAINLSYPSKLKYTFEVFQKLFLELDVLKLSPKVQSLRNKLVL